MSANCGGGAGDDNTVFEPAAAATARAETDGQVLMGTVTNLRGKGDALEVELACSYNNVCLCEWPGVWVPVSYFGETKDLTIGSRRRRARLPLRSRMSCPACYASYPPTQSSLALSLSSLRLSPPLFSSAGATGVRAVSTLSPPSKSTLSSPRSSQSGSGASSLSASSSSSTSSSSLSSMLRDPSNPPSSCKSSCSLSSDGRHDPVPFRSSSPTSWALSPTSFSTSSLSLSSSGAHRASSSCSSSPSCASSSSFASRRPFASSSSSASAPSFTLSSSSASSACFASSPSSASSSSFASSPSFTLSSSSASSPSFASSSSFAFSRPFATSASSSSFASSSSSASSLLSALTRAFECNNAPEVLRLTAVVRSLIEELRAGQSANPPPGSPGDKAQLVLNAPYQIETDLKDRTRDDYARYAPMWVGFVAKKGAAEAKELLDNKMIKAKQALERADDTLLKFLERRRKHVFDLELCLRVRDGLMDLAELKKQHRQMKKAAHARDEAKNALKLHLFQSLGLSERPNAGASGLLGPVKKEDGGDCTEMPHLEFPRVKVERTGRRRRRHRPLDAGFASAPTAPRAEAVGKRRGRRAPKTGFMSSLFSSSSSSSPSSSTSSSPSLSSSSSSSTSSTSSTSTSLASSSAKQRLAARMIEQLEESRRQGQSRRVDAGEEPEIYSDDENYQPPLTEADDAMSDDEDPNSDDLAFIASEAEEEGEGEEGDDAETSSEDEDDEKITGVDFPATRMSGEGEGGGVGRSASASSSSSSSSASSAPPVPNTEADAKSESFSSSLSSRLVGSVAARARAPLWAPLSSSVASSSPRRLLGQPPPPSPPPLRSSSPSSSSLSSRLGPFITPPPPLPPPSSSSSAPVPNTEADAKNGRKAVEVASSWTSPSSSLCSSSSALGQLRGGDEVGIDDNGRGAETGGDGPPLTQLSGATPLSTLPPPLVSPSISPWEAAERID